MESIKIDGENTLKQAASWETRVELLRLELLKHVRKEAEDEEEREEEGAEGKEKAGKNYLE